MKIKFKGLIALFLSVSVLLGLLTGCSSSGNLYSNYQEIEQMQIIQTIGADKSGSGISLSAATGGGQGQSSTAVMRISAPSMVLAMDKLQNYSAQEQLFFSHVNFFLIGQETAENGIYPFLDYIERSTQLRQNLDVFIVKGSSAGDLITSAADTEYNITNIMFSLMNNANSQGSSYTFSSSDITRQLSHQGAALVCAIEPASLNNIVFSTKEVTDALPYGYGVLKDDRLITFIGEDTSRGVNLLLNKTGIGHITIEDPNGGTVTLSLDSSKTTISPVWSRDGSLTAVEIGCTLQAAIAELENPLDLMDSTVTAHLSAAIEKKAENWMRTVLQISQENRADFLGLGRKIEIADPIKFSKIASDWKDLLQTIEIQVQVDAQVGRSYDLINSTNTGGGTSGYVK